MSNDLWGDLPDVPSIRTPEMILVEQAEIITKRTQGLLLGQVKKAVSASGTINVELQVKAPYLNGYTYGVVICRYKVLALYPAEVISDGTSQECGNEAALIDELAIRLKSERTRNAIQSLIAQSSKPEASDEEK